MNLPNSEFTRNLKYDLPAGLIVFLVALPLCLGIALASNAPLFSGLVSGVVAGILVGLLSGSQLSVSGPAAGLTVIVSAAIAQLGSFELFLCAVVLAGVLQIFLGMARAGFVGGMVPNSVIQGMLVAIGLTIILKQFQHLVGGHSQVSADLGNGVFVQSHGVLPDIYRSSLTLHPTALFIGVLSLALLFSWNHFANRKTPILSKIPGPLVAVAVGILINECLRRFAPEWALSSSDSHLVQLPSISGLEGLGSVLTAPNFSGFTSSAVWMVAITIAVIGSLETLLSLEATEKMDPLRRPANSDRELFAQGIGNITSGLLGGLPMTSVIVRSSANVFSGGRTRASAVFHGLFLLLSVLFLPRLLNLIPLASLAAILISVGFKLAHPKVFWGFYKQGLDQFLPFILTVGAVLGSNLLDGVVVGIVLSILMAVKKYYSDAFTMEVHKGTTILKARKDMTFLNKASLKRALSKIPANSGIYFDFPKETSMDQDIRDLLSDFEASCSKKGIHKTVLFTESAQTDRRNEGL
jgi:MFS superfamily sulfate permease-like transporter